MRMSWNKPDRPRSRPLPEPRAPASTGDAQDLVGNEALRDLLSSAPEHAREAGEEAGDHARNGNVDLQNALSRVHRAEAAADTLLDRFSRTQEAVIDNIGGAHDGSAGGPSALDRAAASASKRAGTFGGSVAGGGRRFAGHVGRGADNVGGKVAGRGRTFAGHAGRGADTVAGRGRRFAGHVGRGADNVGGKVAGRGRTFAEHAGRGAGVVGDFVGRTAETLGPMGDAAAGEATWLMTSMADGALESMVTMDPANLVSNMLERPMGRASELGKEGVADAGGAAANGLLGLMGTVQGEIESTPVADGADAAEEAARRAAEEAARLEEEARRAAEEAANAAAETGQDVVDAGQGAAEDGANTVAGWFR